MGAFVLAVTASTAGLTAAVAVATVLAYRYAVGAAIGVLLLGQIAANGSVLRLKEAALTARWAPAAVLAVLLLPELRHARSVAKQLAPLAVVPALAVVSAAWSVDPRLTIERAVSFAVLVWIAAGAAIRFRRRPGELAKLSDAIAIVCVIVVVASVVIRVGSPARGTLNGTWRGVFENPNGLGLFVALAYPFAAAALERRGAVRLQPAILLLAGLICAAAQARSGILALIVGGVGYELARRRLQRLFVYAVAAVCIGGAVALVADPFSSSAPPTPAGGVLSAPGPKAPTGGPVVGRESFVKRLTGARSEAWGAAAGLIGDRPALGYGFGTGDRLFARYPDRARFQFFVGDNPNEAYLQTALELGIVGAVILALVLAASAVAAVRVLYDGLRVDRVAASLTLLALLVTALVESVFTSAGAPWATLLWVSAAVALTAAGAQEAAVPFVQASGRSLWVPSVHQLKVGLAALVVLGGGLGVYFVVRPAPPPPPSLSEVAATLVEHSDCGGAPCRIVAVRPLLEGYWWVHVGGAAQSTCYVVRPEDVHLESGPLTAMGGIAPSSCATLPLREQHVLTAATLPTTAPYFDPPPTDPTGYEPALLREVARELGIGLVRWTSTRSATPTGRVDLVMHELRPTWAVHDPMRFVPTLAIRDALLVRRGTAAARVGTIDAARSLSIGVADDDARAAVDRLIGPARSPKVYAGEGALVDALKSGKVDAAVMIWSDGRTFVNRDHQVVAAGLLPADRVYGLRVGSAELARVIRRALAKLERRGTVERLRAETLGTLPPLRRLR